MMDIPFVRFAFPLLILYLFYWSVNIEPYIPEVAEEETKATLTRKETVKLQAEARDLVTAGKFQEAIAPMSRLREMQPENPEYIRQLAETYHQLDNYKQEAAQWELFLTYAPLPVEGCPQIGQAYLAQGLRAESKRAFERCLALDEVNGDSLFFLGHAFETEGQIDRAESLYRRGLKGSPNYPDLILGLARIEVRRGQLAEARQAAERVLKRMPDNPDALLVAGMVAWRSEDFALARRYLDRGRRISPRYADFGVVLGWVARDERERSRRKSAGAGGHS